LIFAGGEFGEAGEVGEASEVGGEVADETAVVSEEAGQTTTGGNAAGQATPEIIAARQAAAQQFYQDAGFTDEQIAAHLQGIDFSQPVEVTTLPTGTQVVQYQIPGNSVGNYFAPVGTPANTLGIYTSGVQPTIYTIGEPVTVLRSTAASTVDTWSMPEAGWNIQVQGGGTQFFIPNRVGLTPTP
jgi:hypothetical protein